MTDLRPLRDFTARTRLLLLRGLARPLRLPVADIGLLARTEAFDRRRTGVGDSCSWEFESEKLASSEDIVDTDVAVMV